MTRTSNGTSNLRPVCSARKSIRDSRGTIHRLRSSLAGTRCRPKSSTRQDAAVGLQLDGSLVELGQAVEVEVELLHRQLTADGDDGTSNARPAGIGRRLSPHERTSLIDWLRNMIDGVEKHDDLAVDVERVWHVDGATEGPADSGRHSALSVPRWTIQKHGSAGADSRAQLVEHVVGHDQVRETRSDALTVDQRVVLTELVHILDVLVQRDGCRACVAIRFEVLDSFAPGRVRSGRTGSQPYRHRWRCELRPTAPLWRSPRSARVWRRRS